MTRVAVNLFKIEGVAGNSMRLAGRIAGLADGPGENGTPFVQADFAGPDGSILMSVYLDGEVLDDFEDVELDTTDVMFDSLQGWKLDGVGFNFAHWPDLEALAAAGTLQVIYTLTTTEGYVIIGEYRGPLRAVPSP